MSFQSRSGIAPEPFVPDLIRREGIRRGVDLKGIDLLNYLTNPNVSYARPWFGIARRGQT